MTELWKSVVDIITVYPYNLIALTAFTGISLYAIKRYFDGGVCYSKARLDGKTAIVTGANTGCGLETAVDFAQRNGRVILACRNREKGEAAVAEVKRRSGNNNVVFVQLDLASLDSVRSFSASVLAKEPHIDILVNNAGVMQCPYTKTADGFEMQFGVNHLGHFLLTNLLLDRLKEAPAARIVNLTSLGYIWGKIDFDALNPPPEKYSKYQAYFLSKLANILFTRALSKRLQGTRVTTNSVHPGAVRTELARHHNFFLRYALHLVSLLTFKSAWGGAQTSIYCAVSEEMEGVSGQYLADCKIQKLTNPQATDDDIAERLWEVSVQLVGLDKD